jgi:pre-mRNA branch site protein p14
MVSIWLSDISSVSPEQRNSAQSRIRANLLLLSLAQIVLYHHPTRQQQAVAKATELKEREEALAEEKKRLGITD